STEIALGALDANQNGIPDECDNPIASQNKNRVVLCPAGDADTLLVTVDMSAASIVDLSNPNPTIELRRVRSREIGQVYLWESMSVSDSVGMMIRPNLD